MSYQFPENLKYADTHEYVLEENGLLKIGVSEFAIDQLGDIVFVELTDQGKTLEKGETFGTIESVKAVEEVYLPFSGEIVSVNESVIDNPEVLQNDPIGEGWLIVIKPNSKISFADLMTSDAYKSKVLPN
jgi:glycine cleavage system H protein